MRDALAPFRFKGASSYSKLELKRAWLQRLAFIHRLCGEPDVRDVSDVYERLNRTLRSPYQRRHVQTCMSALYKFLGSDTRALPGKAQLARLRAHCKNAVLGAVQALRQLVTAEFKGTRCARAEELPVELPDGALDVAIRKCRAGNTQCRIHEFFEENETIFVSIADDVDRQQQVSEELRQMKDHIRRAQQDSLHLCSSGHCSKLADAIIAVDGKDMDEFAANNDNEWVHIAAVMKKPLLNPVAKAQRPRQL